MRLTGHGLVALALAAWVASLVPSDARQRGAKPPNAGRHMSAPAGGPAKARATVPAIAPFTNRNAIGVTTAPGGFSPPKAVLPTITAPNVTGARPSTFGW